MDKLKNHLDKVASKPNSIDGIIIFNTKNMHIVAQSNVKGGGVGESVEKINWQPFIEIKDQLQEFHLVCHSLGETDEKPTHYWIYFEVETVLAIEPYQDFLIIFVSKQGIGRVGFMEKQIEEELAGIHILLN